MEKKALNSRIFDGLDRISIKSYPYVCNLTTGVSRWSKGAVEYFGLSGEYVSDAGQEWIEHIHPEDRERYISDIEQVFSGERDYHHLDYRVRNKEGEYVFITCTGIMMPGVGGSSDLFLGTIENHSIANSVDSATNLYNVVEFWKHIRELKDAGTKEAVLFIGINNFSEFDRVYGYSAGNRVLRLVANSISDMLNYDEKLYRLEGVSFAYCTPYTEVEQLREIYAQICRMLRHKIFIGDTRIPVTVSCGAVIYEDDIDEYTVQTSALYAMETSRNERSGDLVVFNNEMLGQDLKCPELMNIIRTSIMDNYKGFYLCYQPIVEAQTEKLIGAEALLRWRGEGYGDVMPNDFIPWLENDPSFADLGNWILEKAMTEGKRILNAHPDFIVNVNITYNQISRRDFRGSVVAILQETGFPPENLCFELTERCRQLEKKRLSTEVSFFKSLGIHIAIDDFGTGYSSLNLLSDLEIDTLKFDKEFTFGLPDNHVNQTIIKAITECAKELKVNVCFEGIETRELVDFSRKYNVYSYQGYYYSIPIPSNEFELKYCS